MLLVFYHQYQQVLSYIMTIRLIAVGKPLEPTALCRCLESVSVVLASLFTVLSSFHFLGRKL
jgi:hypothetical protein